MKHTREDGGRHVRADGIIGKCFTESLPVGAPALTPGTRIILRLSNTCEGTVKRQGRPIKYTGCGDSEFLACSERLQRLGGFHSAVIGHHSQQPIVYCPRFLFEFTLANCGIRTLRLVRLLRGSIGLLFLRPVRLRTGWGASRWLGRLRTGWCAGRRRLRLLGHCRGIRDHNREQKRKV